MFILSRHDLIAAHADLSSLFWAKATAPSDELLPEAGNLWDGDLDELREDLDDLQDLIDGLSAPLPCDAI